MEQKRALLTRPQFAAEHFDKEQAMRPPSCGQVPAGHVPPCGQRAVCAPLMVRTMRAMELLDVFALATAPATSGSRQRSANRSSTEHLGRLCDVKSATTTEGADDEPAFVLESKYCAPRTLELPGCKLRKAQRRQSLEQIVANARRRLVDVMTTIIHNRDCFESFLCGFGTLSTLSCARGRKAR
jgi:hypothetical protein